jgi:hypothetical protein
MALTRRQSASLVLSGLALCCWVLMFLAWHDIWHGLGRPDFQSLPGSVSRVDVRAFVAAYSALPILIVVQMVVTITRGPSTAGSRASATAST